MSAEVEVESSGSTMIVNDSTDGDSLLLQACSSWCSLGPPPSMILQIPPPPVPAFLVADYYPSGGESDSNAGNPGGGGGNGNAMLDNSFNSSPCRHSCEWRAEGVHYVEIPQQGSMLDDTWLLVLISSCVGVVLIGVVLAAMLIKCKLQPDDVSRHVNDDASQCSSRSNKNSTLSTSTASSSMQTTTTSGTGPCLSSKTIARLQNEAAVLYPCSGVGVGGGGGGNGNSNAGGGPQEDSRVMWATLTPRGTTRHYLEEHTYETIGGNVCSNVVVVGQPPPPAPPPPPPGSYVTGSMLGLGHPHHHHHHHHHHHLQQRQQQQLHVEHRRNYSESPSEHVNLKTYNEPPAPSPVMTRPKDEKAFDNTAFVDYEEPHSMKSEYYQLDDVLEPCDPIFSVQGMYGMPPRSVSGNGSGGGGVGGGPSSNIVGGSSTLRPRVSSPTRIEHPNLPPLNLQPTLPRSKHRARKSGSINHQQHPPDCTLLRGGGGAYIPTI